MPAEGREGLRRWICVHTPRRLCDLPGDPRANCGKLASAQQSFRLLWLWRPEAQDWGGGRAGSF